MSPDVSDPLKVQEELLQKEAHYQDLAKQTAELWGRLDNNNEQIRAKQREIENHVKRIANLRLEYTEDKAALHLYSGKIKDLGLRKEKLQSNLAEIEASLHELKQVQKNQKTLLKTLRMTFKRKETQKQNIEKEHAEAQKIAISAKDALTWFMAQKNLSATKTDICSAPMKFSTIIPSENAAKSLDDAVNSLQTHLAQRSTDVNGINQEIGDLRIEMTRLEESIATLDKEIMRLKCFVKRTQFNIRYTEKNGYKLEREAASSKSRISMFRTERDSIRKKDEKLQSDIAILRLKTDVTHIQELEIEREKLGEEVNKLRQNYLST
jgi:chromosome segregation ATPase